MCPALPVGPAIALPPRISPPPIPVETTIPMRLDSPWPAPIQCSASAMHSPSMRRVTGTAGTRAVIWSRRGYSRQFGKFRGDTLPSATVMGPALPMPTPTRVAPSGSVAMACRTTVSALAASISLVDVPPVGALKRLPGSTIPVGSTSAASILVPPRSTPRAKTAPLMNLLLSVWSSPLPRSRHKTLRRSG